MWNEDVGDGGGGAEGEVGGAGIGAVAGVGGVVVGVDDRGGDNGFGVAVGDGGGVDAGLAATRS